MRDTNLYDSFILFYLRFMFFFFIHLLGMGRWDLKKEVTSLTISLSVVIFLIAVLWYFQTVFLGLPEMDLMEKLKL